MANTIAKALRSYNICDGDDDEDEVDVGGYDIGKNGNDDIHRSGHHKVRPTRKRNYDIPPAMKLYTVPIYRNNNIDNIMDPNIRDDKGQVLLLKDRIGIYHMDLMEEGFIHFPPQK